MTQREERLTAQAQARRQGVLQAARGLLAARGAAPPSLRAIAAAAGYSAPALYAYFPGREAIFAALFADELPAMGRALKAALAGGAARPIEAGALALYRHALENWAIVRLGLEPQGGDGESLRAATGRLIGALAPLAGALQAHAKLGADAANLRTLMLFAAVLGAAGLEASGRAAALGLSGEALALAAAQAAADFPRG